MLIVYINDIVLSGDDVVEITMLKKKIGGKFEIKENRWQVWNQRPRESEVLPWNGGGTIEGRDLCFKYTLDLLKKTCINGCRPVDTLIEFNAKLKNLGYRVPVDRVVSAFSGKVDFSIPHKTQYLLCSWHC